jgi:hypothetical protein
MARWTVSPAGQWVDAGPLHLSNSKTSRGNGQQRRNRQVDKSFSTPYHEAKVMLRNIFRDEIEFAHENGDIVVSMLAVAVGLAILSIFLAP